VTVDGKPWADFDPVGEWIVLPGEIRPCRIVASY